MPLRKGFLSDCRGNSVIEFAFIFPIVIAMLFGTIEITNMLMVNRKVVATTQNIADLVAQNQTITTADFNDIDAAVEWLLEPFPETPADYGIAHVAFDIDGNASIAEAEGGWTRNVGLDVDTPVARATGMGLGNDAIVVVEFEYDYRPVVGELVLGTNSPFTFRYFAFARPRTRPRIILE